MVKGYFAAAWGDISHTPGWFGKLLRLGLLCLIPVFGLIVLYGYLFAWAREIAWNVHRPLPDKILANEDGNLYRRGFFILVIAFVFSLVPLAFYWVGSLVSGVSAAFVMDAHPSVGVLLGAGMAYLAFMVVFFALSFAVQFFVWVGSMRSALYGTLSSGFQLGKIWAMIRYDFKGLLRIFGMYLLVTLIACVAVSVLWGVVVTLGIGASFMAMGAYDGSTALGIGAIVAALFAVLVCIALIFAAVVCSVFVEALTVRALGYWTRQFEVNRWGGQEDPMPFERREAAARQQVPPSANGGGQA